MGYQSIEYSWNVPVISNESSSAGNKNMVKLLLCLSPVCWTWWGGWKGGWFYSRIIPWSRRAEQTAGEGPVMRLPKVQLYNESFFMPDLCIERQVRKAIRERQLSAIFPLQQYRTSVYFHFIPLSHLLSPSLPFFLSLFFPWVSRSQTFELTV